MQDALDIESAKIMVNNVERGFATGLTVDGKSPEDLINCISGTLRRRKPRTTDWSMDAVVLYDNLWNLQDLKLGTKFNIELTMINLTDPANKNSALDPSANPDNIGQKLVITDCRLQDHSVNITDASTFKMSGRAKDWHVVDVTSF